MKRVLFFVVTIFYTLSVGSVFGQGPGGDISSTPTFWTKSNVGVSTSGSNVTAWANQGSAGATMNTTAAGGEEPTLTSSAVNGYDVITFVEANNDLLETASVTGSTFASTQNNSLFIVCDFRGGPGTPRIFGWRQAAANQVYFETDGDTGFELALGNATGLGSTTNLTGTNEFRLLGGIVNGNNRTIYVDGAQDATTTNTSSLNTANSQQFAIGGRSNASNHIDGDIAEILFFNAALDATDQRHVESYLAIKYGLTLDISSTGYTANISSANTTLYASDATFNTDIVGIGQDVTQGLNQTSSQSEDNGIITLSGTPGDNTFLIVGTNGLTGTDQTGDYNGATNNGSARIWKVGENAEVGNVTITVNKSDLPSSVNEIYVVNNDAALGTGGSSTSLVDGGTTWSVTLDLDNNDYFSFIEAASVGPEIELSGNGVNIANGANTFGLNDDRDFGNTSSIVDRTFTITNVGTTNDLTLNGAPDAVAISGDSDFSILTQPASTTVSSGNGTQTFVVRFNPTSNGTFTATISIDSDDVDEDPFTFTVTGANSPSPGDISTDLSLWLKADAGTTVAVGLSLWEDQSGNNNDAAQGTLVDQPPLVLSSINGNPSVFFDNTDEIDGSAGFYTQEYFVVLEPNVAIDGTANGFALGFDPGEFGGFQLGTQVDGYIPNDRVFHALGDDGDGDEIREGLQAGTLSAANVPVIFSSRNNNAVPTAQEIALNGTDLTVISYTGNPYVNQSNVAYRIGDNFLDNNPFDGSIAEVISYSSRISSASDREDIQTYLAIKYGITLSHNYTFGATTVYDVSTFGNDIAGIGQDDSQGLNQTSSLSESGSGLLTIGSANDLQDGEFLVWGTNGSTGTALTGDYNGLTNNGSARIWKVEETGDVGTVTLTINKSDLPASVDLIYVNNNPLLPAGGTSTSLVDGGATWSVSLNLADGDYFSFIATPAPEISVLSNSIEITNGDATPSIPDNTDFGGVTSGSSHSHTFTISNTGSETLDLQSASAVSISGSVFTVTAQPSQMIAGGATSDFTIQFTPTDFSTVYTETVTITNDDADENPYTFNITGQGAISFFTFDAGTESWTTTTDTDLIPAGTASWITGSSPFSDGDGTNYFHIDPSNVYSDNMDIVVTSPVVNLTGGSSMTLFVNIRYITEATWDGFNIEYNDGGGWTILGTDATGTNWYNDTDVDGIADGTDGWSGDNTLWQTASISLPAALEDNANTQYRVTFGSDGSEDDVGVAFDNFWISGTVTLEPEIDVFGNAVEIADGDNTPDTADDTDFGFIATDIHTFTITNNGNSDLTISGSITLSNTTDFNITQPSNATISAGNSETFTVEFDPSGSGTFLTTVTINSDDTDEGVYTFDVRGSNDAEINLQGLSNDIADGDVTPTTVDGTDFGNSSSPVLRTFTIQNLGNANLTFSTPTISGSAFGVTTPPTSPISGGGNDSFVITFTPPGAGVFTETVSIVSNDADESPYTFQISATNIDAPGDVTSNLGLWLKADAGTTIATGISAWADQSGNGLSADQATADSQPTLNTNRVNGNPAVTFSTTGTADFLNLGNVLNLSPGVDTWSAFFVYNMAVGEEGTLLSKAGDAAANRQYQFGVFENEYFNYAGGTFNNGATSTSTGNWALSSTVTSTTQALDYLAGTLDQTGGVGAATNSEDVLIGARSSGTGFPLDGDIAEIVFYSNNLGDTDRESVESYLAIKYGLTLTHNYVLGATTLYDVSTFPNDIAGIGQDDSQQLDQLASTSESGNGVLSISAATSQDDGDFFIWGTNGATGTDLTGDYNNGVVTSTDNGSARIWKVTQTGDIGTVTLTIDGSNLPSSVTHLIIDGNSDLSSPEQIIELTGGSTPYTITGVDFVDDATSYFSFIGFPEIGVSGNGLPITDGDVTPDVSDDTDFGSTDVGAGSLVKTFTISNSGNAVLNISSINISGSSDFSTPAVSTSLAVGATLDFNVTFDPSSGATITSTVTVNSDDQDEAVFTFDVSGVGAALPEINLQGNSVTIVNGETNFGLGDNREFGDTDASVALSFTIQNLGSSTLTLSQNPTISGTVFSVTANPGSLTIGAASNDAFTVTFTPAGSFGTFTETVTILSDDTDEGTYTFTITGVNLPEPGDVTTNLNLWFKADAGITIATGVSNWADQSGNGNDVSQATGGDQPTVSPGALNGNDMLLFDGANHFLSRVDGWYTRDYFIVLDPNQTYTSASGDDYVIGVNGADFGGMGFGAITGIVDNEVLTHLTNGAQDYRSAIENTTVASFADPFLINFRNNAAVGPTAQEIYLDGSLTTALTGDTFENQDNVSFSIGARESGADQYNGLIAEVINFSARLNDIQRRDVSSYLAVKYGITLDISSVGYTVAGSDIYASDATFNDDIAGIGQDDSQGLDQTTSQSINSTSALSIGNASSQDDGDFLVWGTNGATATDLTGDYNNGVSTGTNNGSARIWKITQTGDIGTVELSIDGASLPTGISHLIIDNNADLSSPEQVIELTGGSSPYTISGVDFNDNATSYFSFIGIPEIAVSGNSINIDDGDMSPTATDDTDFGTVDITGGLAVNTFTITNSGSGNLDISSIVITGSTDFTTPAVATSIAGGASLTFDVTFDPSSLGVITATVTINSNDDDEAAFDFLVQGTGANLGEINLQGNSINIADGETGTGLGDDRDFGDSDIIVDRTFTIQNLGTGTLALNGSPIVSISGDSEFSILTQPSGTSIASGGGDLTFVVRFDATSSSGIFSAIVSIDSDDTNENPYTFTVNGSNVPFPGDFSTNLTLWLKAGDGTRRSSGDVINGEIDEWVDQSVAGNDVSATERPTLQTIDTAFNFNKYLTFSDDLMNGSTPMGINSDGTVFFIGRKSSNGSFDTGVAFDTDGDDPFLGTEGAAYTFYEDNSTPISFAHGTTVNLNELYVFGSRWTNGTNQSTELRLNGETSINATMDVSTGDDILIGGDGAFNWDGDIAEVIVYTDRIGDTESQRIESYLAIKYGLTLNNTNDYIANTLATTNTILFDHSAAGTFINDIAGIGQDNNQGLNQTSSKSVNTGAVLIVSNATSQDDGDFLLWSHNGGSATTLTGDYNGGTNNGLPRIWRVEETGDIGTVTLTIDQSDIESSVNAIYVVNADNTLGTGGQVLGLTDDGNGNWTIDLDLNDDDYFSFINSSEPNIRVLGNGVVIASGDVTPSTTDDTDFTQTAVGATISRTFTISNIGSADLTLQNTFVDITGAGAASFSLQAQPSSPVAAAGTVQFTIDFSPASVATFTATVAIDSDDPDTDPYTFNITGEGTATPEMDVFGLGVEIASGDASPSVVDDTNFGSLQVEQTATKTFTIQNNGTTTLNLSGSPDRVSLSGATTHFSVTSQPGSSIAASGNSSFSVQYAPLAAGIHQVIVSIDNDDPNENPYTFTLQGSATAAGGGSSGDFSCNCVAGTSDITVSTSRVLNDYFPGEADALSGTQTLTLGPRRSGGAGETIEAGDIFLLMQMQGAEINSTLPDAESGGNYGDGAGGNDRAGFVETEDFTAGQYEYVVVTDASAYDENTGGTIEVKLPVVNSYKHQITQASFSDDLGRQTWQLVRVANYLNVTVESGGNITAVPWNGRSGGMIVLDALTSLTLNGGINANGLGFRGGLRTVANNTGNNFSPEVGYRGEGYAGTPTQSHGYSSPPLTGGSLTAFTLVAAEAPGYPGGTTTLDAVENLGGPGTRTFTYTADRGHGGPGNAGGAGRYDGSGGGGGAGNAGGNGSYPNDGGIEDGTGVEPDDEFPNQGIGGGAKDIENGARAFLGGGGGSGGFDDETNYTQAVASGQPGGGVIIIRANNFTGTGSITADGEDGGTQGGEGAGGGGAGGSVIIVTDTEDLGSIILLSSEGGDGSSTDQANDAGGGGGSGGEIIIIRRGGAISDVPSTVRVDGGAAGSSGAGAGVANGGSGGFETTSLPPSANLDCPLINVPDAAPGGVQGLLVWIKADEDVTFDGDNEVSQWIDQSASAFVFDTYAGGQLTTVGSTPNYSADLEGFNFNPAIDFNAGGTSDYLGFTGFSNFSNSALDVFAVSSTSFTANDQTILSFKDDSDADADDNDYNLELSSGGDIIQRNDDGTVEGVTTTNTEIRDGRARIINTRYVDGGDDTEILVNNGSLINQDNGFDVTLNTGLTEGTLVLGQDLDNLTDGGFASNEAFIGQIGEVIIYPTDLNSNERSRVDTYLAIKYGITLAQDQDYLNSFSEVIFPGSTETEYDNNIAGVGRDDASGLTQLRSKSINANTILTGSSENFNTDRSFVVWGSNGISSPSFASTSGGAPTAATDTLDLQWKAYVSGTPGPIDMSFDLTGITNQPEATDVLAILIDEDLDGDFTTGNIRVEPYDNYDFGSGVASFSDISFNDGEPFTLAVLPKAPGGVSANLTMWNRADTGTRNNGGDVTSGIVDEWVDQSQAGNDVTGTEEPTLQAASGTFNFNESLDFSAAGHLFGSTPMGTDSDGAVFLVGNKSSNSGLDLGVGFDDAGLTATDPAIGTFGSNPIFQDDNSSPANFVSSETVSTSQPNLYGSLWTNGTNQSVDLRLDGAGETNSTMDPSSGTTVHIGAESNAGSSRWDGSISEVVIYDEDLTSIDLQKVESYLAIKYGITLDQTVNRDYIAANGAVVFPATSSLPDYISYANDIFGIARDDQSDLSQPKSVSVNDGTILTLTNGNDPDNPATFSSNGTFLMVGNDQDDNGVIEETTSDLPANVTARLDREWRAAVTGNLGEVTLQFDLSTLNGVAEAGGFPNFSSRSVADFKVLVDQDGDFTDGFVQSFDATSYDPGTGIVTITGVMLSDDDIFTLSTAIPAKGPGGVTTGLQLWLRADIGAFQNTSGLTSAAMDGDPVARWDDQLSGQQFENDEFGGITGSSPTYRTDITGFNFNPAIQFTNDGTENDYLANASSNIWGSDLTLLGVFQTNGDDGTVFSYDDDADDAADQFALNNLSGVEFEVGENTLTDFNDTNIADNQTRILAFDYSDASDSYNLYIDGTADPDNSGILGGTVSIPDGGTAVIGQDINDITGGGLITGVAGPGYDDFIGELIVYDQVLSDTDRQKVQTYLGLKYGIFVDNGTTDFLSADGTVVYAGSVTTFDNDIAGIGRDDNGDFLQPRSKSNESSSSLTMEKNEDFNADGQYIVWAHNGQPRSDSTTVGLPSGIESRKSRVWRVQLTNSPTGTVDLTLNLEGDPNDIRLLLDGFDPNFGSATILNPTVTDNGDGTFTLSDIPVSSFTNGGYFTIGSVDEDATPLPVEMLYFLGFQEAESVILNWATATEINNDHFEVQRSIDGQEWQVIGIVDGFGTTSTQQDYSFIDTDPEIGIAYYRLRQVDFDGVFEYSSIVQVNYRFEDFSFNIYPNPFEQFITINIRGLAANERLPYRIVDLAGNLIQEGVFVANDNGRLRREASITGNVASGVYLFHMIRDGRPVIYKLLKK